MYYIAQCERVLKNAEEEIIQESEEQVSKTSNQLALPLIHLKALFCVISFRVTTA